MNPNKLTIIPSHLLAVKPICHPWNLPLTITLAFLTKTSFSLPLLVCLRLLSPVQRRLCTRAAQHHTLYPPVLLLHTNLPVIFLPWMFIAQRTTRANRHNHKCKDSLYRPSTKPLEAKILSLQLPLLVLHRNPLVIRLLIHPRVHL